MKKILMMAVLAFVSLAAFADWSYGTANFRGSQPSNSRSIGPVTVWYNGSLTCKGSYGNTEIWEGTGDICVVYPKNYSGKKMQFTSSGGTVQIQHLR